MLARVFQIDLTLCPACGGHMQRPTVSIIAALTAGASVFRYLDGVGLPSRASPMAPARMDRHLEFEDVAWPGRVGKGSRWALFGLQGN